MIDTKNLMTLIAKHKIITIMSSLVVLFFFSCKKSKDRQFYSPNVSFTVENIRDSISKLNPLLLKKMHSRGCVNNCWDLNTAIKIFRYENQLKELGFSLVWNYELNKYFIIQSNKM
jgi:hypothetical protein